METKKVKDIQAKMTNVLKKNKFRRLLFCFVVFVFAISCVVMTLFVIVFLICLLFWRMIDRRKGVCELIVRCGKEMKNRGCQATSNILSFEQENRHVPYCFGKSICQM